MAAVGRCDLLLTGPGIGFAFTEMAASSINFQVFVWATTGNDLGMRRWCMNQPEAARARIEASHRGTALETGIPSSVISLRMLHAVRTSFRCASSFRALNRPPKRFLYR